MENSCGKLTVKRQAFRKRLFRVKDKSGSTVIRTLLIFLILMILIAFGSQVFMLYTTCSSVYKACQTAIVELASKNSYTQEIFEGMREFRMELDTSNPETEIVTDRELKMALMYDLGLVNGEGDTLIRVQSDNSAAYTIRNVNVTAQVEDKTGYATITYTAYFELIMPVAAYWDYGDILIPMKVISTYRAKL